mmetsp:Transcript_47599/g.140618  ORF Transcript_47599/g.140618 Transcript_47599/m.140618 type:complete len:200 (+) Transcript_47599:256-855(+)
MIQQCSSMFMWYLAVFLWPFGLLLRYMCSFFFACTIGPSTSPPVSIAKSCRVSVASSRLIVSCANILMRMRSSGARLSEQGIFSGAHWRTGILPRAWRATAGARREPSRREAEMARTAATGPAAKAGVEAPRPEDSATASPRSAAEVPRRATSEVSEEITRGAGAGATKARFRLQATARAAASARRREASIFPPARGKG